MCLCASAIRIQLSEGYSLLPNVIPQDITKKIKKVFYKNAVFENYDVIYCLSFKLTMLFIQQAEPGFYYYGREIES